MKGINLEWICPCTCLFLLVAFTSENITVGMWLLQSVFFQILYTVFLAKIVSFCSFTQRN